MRLFKRLLRWWRWHYGRPGRGHVTLAQVNEALKSDYLPMIHAQLNNSNALLKMLGPQTPEAVAERNAALAEMKAEDAKYAELVAFLREQIDALPLRQRWKLDGEWDD